MIHWIDVNEQLPTETMETIAFIKDTRINDFFATNLIYYIDEDNEGNWIFNSNDYMPNFWDIKYWIPMPLFPNEMKEERN